MIKAIIYPIDPAVRATRPTDRNFPNVSNGFLENFAGYSLSNEVRIGFSKVEEAVAVREELARRNPGKMYAIAVFRDAVECPPGDIQYKKINDSGELVNV